MCTSVIFFRKSNKWPIIIGSNRDEKLNRKSKFPGFHWKKKYPNIIGGKDVSKKGSWIGINNSGITALIHNRNIRKKIKNSISRGLIVLNVLKFSKIVESLDYLSTLNIAEYNNFNLLIANREECYWIKHDIDNEKIGIKRINEGITIMTDKDLNDQNDNKISLYYKLFSAASKPNPSKNDWKDWKKILTNTEPYKFGDYNNICFIHQKKNYGTKSSALIALPNIKKTREKIVFKATESFPTSKNYIDVKI